MGLVLVVIALIAAGVYTGAWGFYLAAGLVGAWVVIVTILAMTVAMTARKSFKNFDSNFGNDLFKNRRF